MDVSRLVALLAFAGAVVLPVPHAVAACEVEVSNFEFTPASKTVTPGTTVEWCWREGTHTVFFESGGPNSGPQAGPGGRFSRTFTTAGTYQYYCEFHDPGMSGTITVAAASTSPTTKPSTRPPTTKPPSTAPTTRPPTTAPTVTRIPTPTPTTAAPTTAAPTTDPATTAPATPSTSPAALDIDPAPAKPKTGLAVAIGLVIAAGAFGTVGWLLLKGRSG